jgi:hypothetical protein
MSAHGDTPPDPNFRIDGQTCQVCPPGSTSNQDAQCMPCAYTVVGNQCIQCQPDVVIDGSKDSFNGSWDSTAKTIQSCPGMFWLQIDNPAGFLARGGKGLTGSLFAESDIAQSTCQSPQTLVFNASANFSTSDDVDTTSTGVWTSPGSLGDPCMSLPSYGPAATSLSSQSLRFGVASQPGIDLQYKVTPGSPR